MKQSLKNARHWIADKGMVFKRDVDGQIMGNEIMLGYYHIGGVRTDDVIDNYSEVPDPCVEEEETEEMYDSEEARAKALKVAAIRMHDSSSDVNGFLLNEKKVWVPLEARISMRQSLVALKAEGVKEFTYYLEDIAVTLPVGTFETLLNRLEVYALECYNMTQRHIAEVNALKTIAEVQEYDITAGYPEQLSFTI